MPEDKTPLPPPPGSTADENDGKATADAAFDGRELCAKKTEELSILAATIGCPEMKDPAFAPTRGNLIKAIMAKAKAAEGDEKAPGAPKAVK